MKLGREKENASSKEITCSAATHTANAELLGKPPVMTTSCSGEEVTKDQGLRRSPLWAVVARRQKGGVVSIRESRGRNLVPVLPFFLSFPELWGF